MAFVVEKCFPVAPLQGSRDGSSTPTYSSTWYIQTDKNVPGLLLAEAAAGLTRDDAAEIIPPPARGDSLIWDYAGIQYEDPSAFAFGIDANLFWPDRHENGFNWNIDYTWREPVAGADEQPLSLGLPPLLREPEWWIEYNQKVTPQHEALPILDLITGQVGPPEVIANSAGEAFPPLERTRLLPVVAIARNVQSPVDALDVNEQFEDSVNSEPFNLLGRTIQRHHARYIRSEVGTIRYFDGLPYYRMVTRIELSRFAYYEDLFNEGSYYVDQTGVTWSDTDDRGLPIAGPFPLTATGNLATSVAEYSSKLYLKYQLADFRDLI